MEIGSIPISNKPISPSTIKVLDSLITLIEKKHYDRLKLLITDGVREALPRFIHCCDCQRDVEVDRDYYAGVISKRVLNKLLAKGDT